MHMAKATIKKRTKKRPQVRRVARPAPSTTRMSAAGRPLVIPRGERNVHLTINGKDVRLTNLEKPFWPDEGITKGDLLQYYADVSPVLLPHLKHRAMVMRRYPDGAFGPHFFMKRSPTPRPEWLETCNIMHPQAGMVDYPIINDLAGLMWCVNLGCIDLNPWYATCDDPDHPWLMVFDLDPVKEPKPTPFTKVLETALIVRDALAGLKIKCYPKTSGSRGIHIYAPIQRELHSQEITALGKQFSLALARERPDLITGEFRIAKRPAGRVLVDHNQNAWGKTLASAYSVRPRRGATVSAPLSWKEVEKGIELDDFRMDNMPARVKKVGDLFAPVLAKTGRADLARLVG
jgi:bifunctional non-homologous end joining protein LigD